MRTVIEVNELRKTFRMRGNKNLIKGLFDPQWQTRVAVNDISFSIGKGEAVAFLGPNGAGKTTTTKMLSGLIYPSGGKATVLGYKPFDRNDDFLRRIGLVMGNKAGLNWDLTARQSYWLLQNIYDIPEKACKERLAKLTKMLDVTDHLDTQVRRLSLGERMKLELIGAILHEPEVLFLDEPTIGLDVNAKQIVRDFLRHIQKEQGTTLLLTSHDMDDVEAVCERVLVINHGRIVYDDSLQELSAKYHTNRYVRLATAKAPPQKALLSLGEVLEYTPESVLLRVPRERLGEALNTIAQKFDLSDITIESVPLEQIISDIFDKAPQEQI